MTRDIYRELLTTVLSILGDKFAIQLTQDLNLLLYIINLVLGAFQIDNLDGNERTGIAALSLSCQRMYSALHRDTHPL